MVRGLGFPLHCNRLKNEVSLAHQTSYQQEVEMHKHIIANIHILVSLVNRIWSSLLSPKPD